MRKRLQREVLFHWLIQDQTQMNLFQSFNIWILCKSLYTCWIDMPGVDRSSDGSDVARAQSCSEEMVVFLEELTCQSVEERVEAGERYHVAHPWKSVWQFSKACLHKWMPFIIFIARSCERLQVPFPGQFLSRCCFTLCLAMEVEPRIAKQYKCYCCCIYKNYKGKVVEDEK